MPHGPMRDGMEAMYQDYSQFGFPGGHSLVLRAVLGREPRTPVGVFPELARR